MEETVAKERKQSRFEQEFNKLLPLFKEIGGVKLAAFEAMQLTDSAWVFKRLTELTEDLDKFKGMMMVCPEQDPPPFRKGSQ